MRRFLEWLGGPWAFIGLGVALMGVLAAGFDDGAARGVGVLLVLAGGIVLGHEHRG